MVLRRSSADCGASAPARTASSSASTSCLFMDRSLRVISNSICGICGGLGALAPGLEGGVDDLLERNAIFKGPGVTVFVFGLGVSDGAIKRCSLDADLAVWSGDGNMRAIESAALFGAGADAESGGFTEEEFFESRRIGGAAEDGDEGAEAPLLHDNGGRHDVERAVLESELRGVRDDLRRKVVDGA